MATIKMTRIDYRLIHGQVVHKWIKYDPVEVIVVADNQLVEDEFMADIYKMAAPGCKVEIVSIDDLNKTLDRINKSIMLVFRNVEAVCEAVDKGTVLTSLNVGAVESAPGRKQIIQGVSLSQGEIDKLEALNNKGINVFSQPIPENAKMALEDMKAKI